MSEFRLYCAGCDKESIKVQTEDKSSYIYTCKTCGKITTVSKLLIEHERSKNKIPLGDCQCERCCFLRGEEIFLSDNSEYIPVMV